MKSALYAGSFDPPTNGHMYVVKTAANMFDKLYIGVAQNASKNASFSADERHYILKQSLGEIEVSNAAVIVISDEFAARVAARLGCQNLIRGVRGASDLEVETAIAHVNMMAAPNVSTITIPALSDIANVSSSMVRGLVGLLGWRGVVRRMVPAATMRALERKRADALYEDRDVFLSRSSFTNLFGRYLEEHRVYHGIGHIIECLEWLEHAIKNNVQIESLSDITRAIWYHDAIYDPTKHDNERLSADLAADGHGPVAKMILATARHFDADFRPEDPDTQLLLDIDIASFGESFSESEWIAQAIRKEYAFVPANIYCRERAKLLDKLLARPHIYRTKFFRERLEEAARHNIKKEIDSLRWMELR